MQPRSALREPLRILVLDRDPAFQRRLTQRFQKNGQRLEIVTTLEDAERSIERAPVDAMIVSFEVADGADGLLRLARLAPAAPMIVTLAESSVSATVAAMRSGADDVIIRRAAAGRFSQRLTTLMRTRRNEMTADRNGEASSHPVISAMIGTSDQVQSVRARIERFARSDAPVLISGQGGTGREFAASMIHKASARSDEAFVVLDCANENDDTIRQQILGDASALGLAGALIAKALGGTLVLKNADHLSPWLQAAIAERLTAPGQAGLTTADDASPVRLITLVGLNEGSAISSLRPELFHSLAVLTLALPALNARREDILPLARSFLEQAAGGSEQGPKGFSNAAERKLLTYDWPGNLDELAAMVQHAIVRTKDDTIDADCLPFLTSAETNLSGPPSLSEVTSSTIEPYRDQERRIIENALAAFDGNITRAAAALEISPSTIHRKRQSWEAAA